MWVVEECGCTHLQHSNQQRVAPPCMVVLQQHLCDCASQSGQTSCCSEAFQTRADWQSFSVFLSSLFFFSQNLAKAVRQQIGICLDHRLTFHSVTGGKLMPAPPLSSGEKERKMIKNSPLRCRGQSRRASPEIPNSSKLLYSLPKFTPLLWVQVVQWLCRLVSLFFFFSSC